MRITDSWFGFVVAFAMLGSAVAIAIQTWNMLNGRNGSGSGAAPAREASPAFKKFYLWAVGIIAAVVIANILVVLSFVKW